jgi:supervillin
VKGKKKTKKKRTETQNVRALLAEFNRVYTYEELQAKPPPKGLDKTKLEQYLSDDEFAKVLQMTKDEFYALPSWKQNKIRQQINLY